jgi:competence protein ComGC
MFAEMRSGVAVVRNEIGLFVPPISRQRKQANNKGCRSD